MVHPNTFTFPHQWSALRLEYIKCHYRLYLSIKSRKALLVVIHSKCAQHRTTSICLSWVWSFKSLASHASQIRLLRISIQLYNKYSTSDATPIAFIHDVHDVICCKSMTCLWHSTQIFRIFGIFHVFEANKEDFLNADAEPPAKPKRCVL